MQKKAELTSNKSITILFAMKESLSLPEGVTIVDPGEKSSAEIAFDLISEGKSVVLAGVDYTGLRKVWIFKATGIDSESKIKTLNGYKGWQYSDGGTFGHVDTEAGEYGGDIGYPDLVSFVAEVDERLLDKTVDEVEVMTVIDYALMHGTPETGVPSI